MNTLRLFLFALLLSLAACARVPDSIRRGPAPVSLAPVSEAVQSAGKRNEVRIAQATRAVGHLDAARRLADASPKIEGAELYRLRLELSKAQGVVELMRISLEKEREQTLTLRGLVDAKQKEGDEKREAYRKTAEAEWKKLRGDLWRTRLFGFPVSFALGALAGAVVTFVFRVALGAAWAGLRARFGT